jgi:hypothetical protein
MEHWLALNRLLDGSQKIEPQILQVCFSLLSTDKFITQNALQVGKKLASSHSSEHA